MCVYTHRRVADIQELLAAYEHEVIDPKPF